MRISLYNCQECGDIIPECCDVWRCHDMTYCSQGCIYKKSVNQNVKSSYVPVRAIKNPIYLENKVEPAQIYLENKIETIVIIIAIVSLGIMWSNIILKITVY